MEAFAFNASEQGLLIAAGALLVIQAIYYFALYNRINLRNRAARKNELRFSDELPPVSILICAHNETENLRRSLPAMLAQDYPQFELIVINDGEKNENEAYLSQLENQHKNLYHSFVPNSSRYISRKKLAITLGIRAARYEWLVLTEANCLPQSDQWLRLLARNFTSCTEVEDIAAMKRAGDGFRNRCLSTISLLPCAIWGLRWPVVLTWASGGIWHIVNHCSSPKRDSRRIWICNGETMTCLSTKWPPRTIRA